MDGAGEAASAIRLKRMSYPPLGDMEFDPSGFRDLGARFDGPAGRPALRVTGQRPPAEKVGPERRTPLLARLMAWLRARGRASSFPAGMPHQETNLGPATPADLLLKLFDTLHEEVAIIDERGLVRVVNSAWRAAFSATTGPKSVVGRPYVDICRVIAPDVDSSAFRNGVRDIRAGRSREVTLEFAGATGRRRQMRLVMLAPRGAAVLAVIHEAVDATGSEAEVLNAQYEERQRIAMELHDSTGQHLAALGLGLLRLRRFFSPGAEDLLDDMSRLVAEVGKEIRVQSYLMRLPGLKEEGLESSVRTLLRGFETRTGLETRFLANGPVDEAPEAVAHAAYRMVQEGLTNAFRHAGARSVEIRLELVDEMLAVRVIDDGKGVPGLKGRDLSGVPLGVGIVSMQTRAASLGGRIEISCEGGFTQLLAMLPAAADRRDLRVVSRAVPPGPRVRTRAQTRDPQLRAG